MQVNKVDYANSYRAKGDYTKIIRGSLQDNTEALVRIGLDGKKNVNRIEYLIHDEAGHVKGGQGLQKKRILGQDVIPMLKDLNTRAKEGVDFLDEFLKAMMA